MKALISTILLSLLLPTALLAAAKDEVGTIVALRGTAKIARAQGSVEAKIKSPVLLADSITTGDAARLKLLFIDDSVLTLAEKSRVVIKDFIHSKENRGQSIFNLLDGKMRAVVGKTKFQVQTPTAVAAARGTVIFFEVGELNGKTFTKIVCFEGIVEVNSTSSGGTVTLTPGMMVIVFAGEPMPVPTQVSPQELEQLKMNTATTDSDVSFPEPHLLANDSGLMIVEIPPIGTPIQVTQQPVDQSRTATITISVQ